MLAVLLADDLRGIYFRQPWPLGTLFLLIAAALFLSAFIYRGEASVALWKRVLMGSFRAIIFILILLVLFEPVRAQTKKVEVPSNILVLLDVSESMNFADSRKRPQELEEAALALGKMKLADTALPDGVSGEVARPTRLELAKGILSHPELKVFRTPTDKYRLHYFSFGERLEAAPDEPEKLRTWLADVKAQATATRLGEGLQQAVERFSGQPLSAVIVLTDGASNAGVDPLEAARSLHAPVFPVGIGLTRPDDIRVATATVPEAVFPKDKVPVRVQIQATPGYVGREVELTVKAEGRELDRKRIVLKASQLEELTFVPDKTGGLLNLDIGVSPLPGEATEENNRVARAVRIIDEKIKVLYIEGKPRWEYRYLRAVLMRDHRMTTKFLMTEGDADLAKASDQYIARLPEDEAGTFQHDLVILGDVRADYFTPAQLAWIEKLVRDKGGSFLMLAGHQHAPMSYGDTPIAKLLPVKLAADGREAMDPNVYPTVTQAGAQSLIMALEPGEEDNAAAWSLVQPLHDLPRLNGAKPGATVLATLSNQGGRTAPYPLIAWQRYGSGKSMFVGTDQLWRMRKLRGDAYHAGFWSQSIQFLTLSRLLGENKRVRLETDRKSYNIGERVLIQATLLDEEYRPLRVPAYNVLIEPVPPKGEARSVSLKPVAGMDGMYQGYVMADKGGIYQVRAMEANDKDANRSDFQVETLSREKLELDMKGEQLKKLAELTGGRVLTARDLATFVDELPSRTRTVTLPPEETELWNNWWLFSVILSLAGMEWLMRRTNDIA